MIDLSRYSGTDEEVQVTFRDGNSSTGKLFLYDKEKNTYLFKSELRNSVNTMKGIGCFTSYDDIVKVEPVNLKPIKINLSHFVGKNVRVTYTNGEERIGVVTLNEFLPSHTKQYRLVDKNQNRISDHYHSGTCYYFTKNSIIKVELVNPEKPKQMYPNTLDPKTLNTIASALTPETIKYIESHEKYAEVMQALIIEFVEKNVGVANNELPFMIFDNMHLAKVRD